MFLSCFVFSLFSFFVSCQYIKMRNPFIRVESQQQRQQTQRDPNRTCSPEHAEEQAQDVPRSPQYNNDELQYYRRGLMPGLGTVSSSQADSPKLEQPNTNTNTHWKVQSGPRQILNWQQEGATDRGRYGRHEGTQTRGTYSKCIDSTTHPAAPPSCPDLPY